VPVQVVAPLCVQATFFERKGPEGTYWVVHLLNGLNTAANHGLPASEVPLREEAVPISGIRVRFLEAAPTACVLEPGAVDLAIAREGRGGTVELPPVALHVLLAARMTG
jgi:hypothetical protein